MSMKPNDAMAFANPMVGVEVAAAMTRAMFHSMSVWNRQMAKFVGHRLEMDARLQEQLSRSQDPFEAYQAMTDFMRDAFVDYSREAETLQTLAADTAEENLVDLEAELNPKRPPVID